LCYILIEKRAGGKNMDFWKEKFMSATEIKKYKKFLQSLTLRADCVIITYRKR
jgi:hypothetical protein